MAQSLLHVLGLLLVVFVTFCTGQSNSTGSDTSTSSNFGFDCRRNGGECGEDGSCNLTTGQCNCQGQGNFNYFCIDKDSTSLSCNPPCVNGFCSNGTCACPENFYGRDCSLDRAKVLCKDGKMFVNINPFGAFSGKIFVQSIPSCVFTSNKTSPSQQDFPNLETEINLSYFEGWWKVFPSTDANCVNVNLRSGADTALSAKFIIQYSNIFKSAVDQVVTTKCTSSQDNVTVSSDVTNVTDSDSSFTNVDAEGGAEVVTLRVLKQDRSPIKGGVILGESIYLVANMFASSKSSYVDFQLLTCSANNNLQVPNANYNDLQFIVNGCPQPDAISIFSGPTSKSNDGKGNVTIDIALKAFMFVGSSNVVFVCNIGFCAKNNSVDCQPKSCAVSSSNVVTTPTTDNNNDNNTAPSNPIPVPDNNTIATNGSAGGLLSRRKRAPNDPATVEATIKVIDPQTQDGSTGTNSNSFEPDSATSSKSATTEDCINNPDIVVIIAILSVCVFVLFVATIYLIYCLKNAKKKPDFTGNVRSSRPEETVRFPRLELTTPPNNGGC